MSQVLERTELDRAAADGRMIAAARMLAGLDQSDLAWAASVSASTISNIESGKVESRRETKRAIVQALIAKGVSLHNDRTNGRIQLSMNYSPATEWE